MPDDRESDRNGEEEGREEAAPRPFWSGILTFGLVSVPVNLFAGYRSARPSLRMVDTDGTPLERRYFCPAHDRALEWDEIVRGYEVEEGRFVVVRDEELEALEPEKSREIDLQRFVDRDDLDPILFERAYFLTPASDATKPYRLLARAMEEAGRAGIATFVMRGREYLVAILADDGVLRAETMRFHDEIRSAEDVGLPEPEEPADEEVEGFLRAVEGLAADELEPDELRDRWSERLRELTERKRSEGEGVVERRAEAPAGGGDVTVIDLMEVLKRNLRGEGGAGAAAGGDGEGGPEDGLEEKTKKELYERAQALEIEGRSSMTKDELVAAIRRAS